MKLRSRALADRGAHIAGCSPLPAGRAVAPVSGVEPLVSTRPSDPPYAGAATICTVAMPDGITTILSLAAAAAGVERDELVRRAIVFYADKHVGLPGLAIESRAKASEDNGATGPATEMPADCVAGEVSRPNAGGASGVDDGRLVEATGGAAPVITLFTPEGDLLSAPEPKRFGPNRFRSHAPP